MFLNPEIIKSYYERLPRLIGEIRKKLDSPLTLSEKILYAHLFDRDSLRSFSRGVDYVEFAPDRVAMQDATAQMALLQFIMAGKDSSAVPASVHCDHLIMAKTGSSDDLRTANVTNREVFDFLSSICDRYDIVDSPT